mgnify:CR=1 FL=1
MTAALVAECANTLSSESIASMLTVVTNAVVVPRAQSPTVSDMGLEATVEDGRINAADQAS